MAKTCELFIGIDLHKAYSQVAVIDSLGKVIEERRLSNNLETITGFFSGLKGRAKGVVEASGSWYWFVDHLKSIGFDIFLAHPLKVKMIASAKIKTDRIDAKILGNLLRADLIPMSYIASEEEIEQRSLLRFRFSLMQQKTKLKNSIHSILTKYNIAFNGSDLFSVRGIEFLKTLNNLPEYQKHFIGQYLELIEDLGKRIKNIDEKIKKEVGEDEDTKLLTTIPGVGNFTALLLKAEIGDITRFPSDHHLCSYFGLVPSVHQSGKTSYSGKITKQGDSSVRWALGQAALAAVRREGYLKECYEDISNRSGKPKAKVAVARKILSSAYFVLTRKQPYYKPSKKELLSDPKRS
jgi:transposase